MRSLAVVNGDFVQVSMGPWLMPYSTGGRRAHSVVLRGWRAGELLSEMRMRWTHDACGMLSVQPGGEGGQQSLLGYPTCLSISHLSCTARMCVE